MTEEWVTFLPPHAVRTPADLNMLGSRFVWRASLDDKPGGGRFVSLLYFDGQRAAQGTVVGGKPVGVWQSWRRSGSLVTKLWFQQGVGPGFQVPLELKVLEVEEAEEELVFEGRRFKARGPAVRVPAPDRITEASGLPQRGGQAPPPRVAWREGPSTPSEFRGLLTTTREEGRGDLLLKCGEWRGQALDPPDAAPREYQLQRHDEAGRPYTERRQYRRAALDRATSFFGTFEANVRVGRWVFLDANDSIVEDSLLTG